MATIDYKPYDQGEVESIRLMLEAEAKEGTPLCFDVKVNGNTRIHKTNKVERFNELYNFINDTTKELVINVYPDPNNNNRKEWYKYTFGKTQEEGLNGGDMEQKLNERMRAFEEKQAAKRIEEKLKDTQEQLSQAEDYIRILEEKLEAAKIKPNHFGEWDLGKLGSSIIQGVAIHHPKILEKVPVLNGIAKVIQEDIKSRPQQLNGSFEGDVSFKPKNQSAPEVDESILVLRDFIEKKFDERQKNILGLIIMELGEKTHQLEPVAELLNIELPGDDEEEEESEN
ncbi:MAG: hypothetical protein JST26_07865 [Bacteroidetes bacterium]|nr:hypothetical protein [Bacteroidota bacterium]